MRKLRQMLAFVLVLAWAAPTAFACLPNPQMTEAEMACCKKMKGDCNMGSAQHPCCKTAPAVKAPVATIQPIAQLHFNVAIVAFAPSARFEPTSDHEFAHSYVGLPPPAPPGPNSVLRI